MPTAGLTPRHRDGRELTPPEIVQSPWLSTRPLRRNPAPTVAAVAQARRSLADSSLKSTRSPKFARRNAWPHTPNSRVGTKALGSRWLLAAPGQMEVCDEKCNSRPRDREERRRVTPGQKVSALSNDGIAGTLVVVELPTNGSQTGRRVPCTARTIQINKHAPMKPAIR